MEKIPFIGPPREDQKSRDKMVTDFEKEIADLSLPELREELVGLDRWLKRAANEPGALKQDVLERQRELVVGRIAELENGND